MSDAGRGSPTPSADERGRLADLWEHGADERERLADERERVADEREGLADERDRLADRHERLLGHRDEEQRARDAVAGDEDQDAAMVAAEAAASAALERAEQAARRAEDEVQRAREAAERVQAWADRRDAARARAEAADARADVDEDEASWALDRRDFVAARRDVLAGERDSLADERDATADARERAADLRERDALAREVELDRRSRRGTGSPSTWSGSHPGSRLDEGARDQQRQRRERAASGRRAAAVRRAAPPSDWAPDEYGPTLLASFSELAAYLVRTDELADALPALLSFAVGAVPACDGAALRLASNGGGAASTASDPVVAELEQVQRVTGDGPVPAALAGEGPGVVAQLDDSRWPALATAAQRLGVISCLTHALPLRRAAAEQPVGAFTMYSASLDAFGPDDVHVCSILAAYAAVAVAQASRRDDIERREAALHRSLSTRDVIGQAKGILMERHQLSAGDAFDVLRTTSQRLNRRLADVADHLARTGELP